MAAAYGIEEGVRLHAKYEGEFYPATVVAVSEAKNRTKKPVKVCYKGFDDEVWLPISSLKNKKLGLKGEADAAPAKEAPKPKAKVKAKAKAKVKAKKSEDGEEKKKRDPVKFFYFPVWAKGPGICMALEHSGIDWVGEFPAAWKDMKPTTPFCELPVLDIPGLGMIGHELAIYNYIGKRSKKMDGYNMADFLTSQQLMNESEDIYKRLGQIKNGAMTAEQEKAFWENEDATTHNKDFGMKVYLSLLDKFYTKCHAGEKSDAADGKFTKSGITCGECKLFSILYAVKLIKDDILGSYAGLKVFYERFVKLEKTEAVINGTGKMPGVFNKYF